MDKNICILEGVINDDAKWGKKKDNGREYFTFTLIVNSYNKEFADDTERNFSLSYVRIFVYDKLQLEYLHKVDAKRGQRATIFGRLQAYKAEYKGHSYFTLSVVCRDVKIIKTKEELQINKQ